MFYGSVLLTRIVGKSSINDGNNFDDFNNMAVMLLCTRL